MSSSEFPDYADTHQAMQRAGLTVTPSEAHGIASGLIAGDVADPLGRWAETLYADLEPNDVLAQECRALLDQLFEATTEQMRDTTFGLNLWLPPEAMVETGYDIPSALRDWAQGFLYGLGLAGDKALDKALSAEGKEALRDFYEISRLETAEGELGEEEQQAAAEIEEYMRVAAMLINEDMHRREPTGEVSHEIH
ncbi:MAG: hypothetical protein D6720_01445 [Gammaproteobacteria bacterium]|nr:MAG: hypothetical protein D6720_01445 [Gammaproteobacteria bacterium]